MKVGYFDGRGVVEKFSKEAYVVRWCALPVRAQVSAPAGPALYYSDKREWESIEVKGGK